MRAIVREASVSFVRAKLTLSFRPSFVRERFSYAEGSTTTNGNNELKLIGGEVVGGLLLSFLHEVRFQINFYSF